MKTRTTKSINGVTFDVNAGKTVDRPVCGKWDYPSIYDAYKKPSRWKVEIWKRWKEWERWTDAVIWIQSCNCFKFTIAGYVTDEDGTDYAIYITDTRRELTPIG